MSPISDYGAAKFGVRRLWKSLWWEARARYGVRTNLIAPTFIATQAISAVKGLLEEKGARLGRVEDAVDAVLRVACDEGIDGGRFPFSISRFDLFVC